jgi:TrmH family RNA methyltransferase
VTGVIVCDESANPFSWKAVRGSMGSLLRLPVWRGASSMQTVAALCQRGARIIAAVPAKGADPDVTDWSGPVALVIGGEGGGLGPHVISHCDQLVTIPMTPPVESLNVAAAAAVLLYAARRARS